MVNMEVLRYPTPPKFAVCIAMCMLTTAVACAQQTTSVKSVKGEWMVSNDITLPEAKEKAIAQAKAEAMRVAGAPELISESTLSYRSEVGMVQKELFESVTGVDAFGEIAAFSVVKEEKKFNDFGNLMYTVWIDADVIVHKDVRDPGFNFDVTGLHEKYGSPDKLVFEVKAWKDSYLTAFVISGKEGVVLYPNRIEKKQLLKAGQAYKFPGTRALEYEISTEDLSEINYLVLLVTREDIPFMAAENPADILRFVAGINPRDKALKTHSFLIRKAP
jgi:hypothetical protein